ncbi:hypothetical protein GGR91_001661 [Sphingorhabdus rigui]|uniref:Uncharacterized protein n=1 Tax=Sphingorhabdus rigui TaxID=1282858 RepID=A0A840B0F4_9SPHN|nr:hypothetical protein [Sphingorhabdus rigui]
MATRKACAVVARVNYNGCPGIVAAAVQCIAGAFDESALGPFDGAHRSFMRASLLIRLALYTTLQKPIEPCGQRALNFVLFEFRAYKIGK